MTETLEHRLRRMEDIHAITVLKAAYIDACDGGWDRPSHNADAAAALFTEDGWWEAEGFPRLVGREAIRTTFATFAIAAPFAFHAISNPLINGETGTGQWHLSEVFTDAEGNEIWAAGIYDDTFARTAQGWRIKTLTVRYAYNGPYAKGFAANWKSNLQK